MIGITVQLYPKEGHEDLVQDEMRKFASTCVANEIGTLMYTIVKDEAGVLGTMELYLDEEALQVHAKTDYHDELGILLKPYVEKATVKRFHVLHHPTV